MKNKKMVYILLILSVIVWGGIIYRIFNVYQSNDSGDNGFKVKPKTLLASSKDSFQLLLNYTDPFYKKNIQYSSNDQAAQSVRLKVRSNNSVVKKAPINAVVNTIDWSFILYKGSIKRKANDKVMVISLINIHGEEYSVEENKQAADVLIVKNCRDSILVKYKGILKYIKRG